MDANETQANGKGKDTAQPAVPPQGPIDKKKIGVGLILVIIVIIAAAEFSSNSGSPSTPADKQKQSAAKAQPTAPGQIGIFQKQTTEDAQELARIKAQKDALSQTLAAAQAAPSPFAASAYGTPAATQPGDPSLEALQRQQQMAAAGYYAQPAQQNPATASADQLAIERRKREYESLFASNVALDLSAQQKAPVQPLCLPKTTSASWAARNRR
jgi:hypothetical protein